MTLVLTFLIFHNVPSLSVQMEGNGMLENLEDMSLKVLGFQKL